MKSRVPIAVAFLMVLTSLQAQEGFHNPLRDIARDHREAQITLEGVDFSALHDQARRRRPAVSSDDLEHLVRANFQFIFFNKLNRRSFILTPEPDIVVQKIGSIFRLNEEILGLIDRGRRLGQESGSGPEKEVVVGQIAELADQLHDTFRRYFIEIRASSYTFDIRPLASKSGQFSHYIRLTGKMSQLLDNEIEDYFLNSKPGIVDVAKYDEVTIGVLAESLMKVSDITSKRLRQ